MELSCFLKVYPFPEKPGHVLLFSTKNSSKIIIKKKIFNALEKGHIPSGHEAVLSRLGMIVEDRVEERRAMLGFFKDLDSRNRSLDVIAVVNLDCNFSCIYCYEGKMKGNLYMSERNAGLLREFIRNKFTPDKDSLLLDYYGGEPLLSLDLILSISRSLKSFAEEREASFSFSLVTNGSLFTRRVAEALVPLGLRSVKITLDGPKIIHDRSRPFKSGAGSFDTIIKNIKETCDIIKVGIGGNFEKENYKEFILLLDSLEQEGLTAQKIHNLKFDPVVRFPGDDRAIPEYKGGCVSIDEPWLIDAIAELREEILKRGYHNPAQGPFTCITELRDSYVVNFDGTIYKCPAFLGKEEFAVGNIETGVTEYSDIYGCDRWKNDKCLRCEYLPLCFGGCKYMSIVRGGNIHKPDCQEAFLDAALEILVKQDIRYGIRADSCF